MWQYQPPQLPPRRRNKKLIIWSAIAFVVLLTAGTVFLHRSPSQVTMSGMLTVTYDPSTPGILAPIPCSAPSPSDITDGSRVVVKAPDGVVIGTGVLKYSSTSGPVQALGCDTSADTYSFKVSGLPSDSQYGVTIGSHGTIWEKTADLGHVSPSLGN